jgi:pimeloyl-ACP methyl ester carboxylesterase
MRETNGVVFATTRLATDETLHYAERSSREGETIIFLHGYSDSWYSFSRVVPLLSAELRPGARLPNSVSQLPNT